MICRRTIYDAQWRSRRRPGAGIWLALLCSATISPCQCPVPTVGSSPPTPGTSAWGYVVTGSASCGSAPFCSSRVAMGYNQPPEATTGALQQVNWGNAPWIGGTTNNVYRVIVPPGSDLGIGYIGQVTFPSTNTFFDDTGLPADPTMMPVFTPTLSYYEGAVQKLEQTMRAQIVGVPQPRIKLAGEHVLTIAGTFTSGFSGTSSGCTPYYGQATMPTDPCPLANITALNQYTDALARAGVQIVDMNLDPLALKSSTQYHAMGTDTPLTPDCTGAYSGSLPSYPYPGGVLPTGGPYCQLLSVLDQAIYYAQNTYGMAVRFSRPSAISQRTQASAI